MGPHLFSLVLGLQAPQGEAAPPPHQSIEVGARVAVRPEGRLNPTLGAEANDARWRVLQAARIDAAGTHGPFSVVVQLQDVRAWGQSLTPNSDDAFTGVHQGYLEVAGQLGRRGRGYVRVGRQEIQVWTGRFLAPTPWIIGRRAFDALRAGVEFGRVQAEVGAMITRAPRTFTTEAGDTLRTHGDQIAWAELGVDAHEAFQPHAGVWLRSQGATEATPDRDVLYASPGGYVHGEPVDGLAYDVEGYGQIGRNGPRQRRAWSANAAVNYAIPVRLKPGLRVSYELASGSQCAAEPVAGTPCPEAPVERDFDGMFGYRHLYRGFADMVGTSNYRDLHLRSSLQPDEEVSFWLDYHFFQLHEPRGNWVDITETSVGRPTDPTNVRNLLAHEVDLLVNYRPFDGGLEVRPGYSVFIPSELGRALSGPQVQHFAYVWLVAQLHHRWER